MSSASPGLVSSARYVDSAWRSGIRSPSNVRMTSPPTGIGSPRRSTAPWPTRDAVGGRAVDNTGDDDPGRRLEIVRLGDESVDGVETDPQIGVVVRPRVDECRNDAFGERRRNREPDVVAAAGVDNPATAPSRSTSGPPLLPGLAGRVGLDDVRVGELSIGRSGVRLTPLTIPDDIEPLRPYGLPTAATSCPTTGRFSVRESGDAVFRT